MKIVRSGPVINAVNIAANHRALGVVMIECAKHVILTMKLKNWKQI